MVNSYFFRSRQTLKNYVRSPNILVLRLILAQWDHQHRLSEVGKNQVIISIFNHDAFQQTLNGTNLIMLIKAESTVYRRAERQQLAGMQTPLKCNGLHLNIIWCEEAVCYCCWPHFLGKPARGYWQDFGLAGERTGLGISVIISSKSSHCKQLCLPTFNKA